MVFDVNVPVQRRDTLPSIQDVPVPVTGNTNSDIGTTDLVTDHDGNESCISY